MAEKPFNRENTKFPDLFRAFAMHILEDYPFT